MARVVEGFWAMLPAVRRRERSRTLFFAALLLLVTAAQTAGLAGSEALFLATLSAARLPGAFVAASLLTVLGSLAYAAFVGRVRNDVVFAWMLGTSGLGLVAAAALAREPAAVLLYALVAFFYLAQAVFTNHFWTFSGDYFDAVTSKRLFPVFTVGASLGGLAGGAAGVGAVAMAGPGGPIALWGILLCAAAALLRTARRSLRRWGPLELEEADETSVEGLRGAAACLRRSPLGRWLVLSSLGMVLALFVAQYLYSDLFVRAYPDPAELATFIALYLAATNLVEIALELAVTPWLIRRFGVASAHVVHPVLTLASFGGLAVEPALAAGVAARMNRELVENAVAQPVRTLAMNALPPRFRGRIRAFLEGIVVYAGMSVAGALLLALDAPDARTLAGVGGAAALLYLGAALGTRRAYLRTLVQGIRAGRLDLADLDRELGDWEVTRIAEVFSELLRTETGRPSRSLLQVVPVLGHHGLVEPLARGLAHPQPRVRLACVRALAPHATARPHLASALDDRDAEVRLAAARALAGEGGGAALGTRREALLRDPDPRVRATTAATEADSPVLDAMLAGDDRDAALAALRAAPPARAREVARRAGDPDPVLRAAALERLAEIAPDAARGVDLAAALAAPDAPVRRAALRLLARDPSPAALDPLAAALADPAGDVRDAAAAALARRGEAGARAARPRLRSASEATATAALAAVAAGDFPGRRHLLARALRRRARSAWWGLLALERLPADPPDAAHRFLRAALADAVMRDRRLAFRALEHLESPRVIRKVQQALRSASTRARGDALEVLSNLGDREAARLLVLMHEAGPLDERAAALGSAVAVPRDAGEVLAAARRSDDPRLALAAAAVAGELGDNACEAPLVERLLALKRVPLFANLTLDQLEAVGQLAREATYLPGEAVLREGEPGTELYVLLEGSVEVFLDHGGPGQTRVSVMEAVASFGEMAILDGEPRSATVVAREPCRLLVLDGESLESLVRQMPEISFEVFRVLTGRVRAAERRLRERG